MHFPEQVLVLTTGGTIDKIYFDAKSDYEVGETVVGELLQQAHVTCPFEVRSILRKDSLELTDEDRAVIRSTVESAKADHIIVTHGTDTMPETASSLAGVNKTVVLTGALAPARFAQSDATFNVGMAFAAVQCLPPGVYIVMNGQVFEAGKVIKDRARNQFLRVTP